MAGTIAASSVTGVILAGGQSRRMGGGDKGMLELAGKPMLAHVIERLAPQVGRMVINANGDPARFAGFARPVVADTITGFVGPLAGVLAGMRWSTANAPEARWIVTAAGDAPMLPADLVSRLTSAVANRDGAIALAKSAGGVHPVIGLWPVALAADLEDQLRSGVRKVLDWTDRHGTVPVDFPMPAGRRRRGRPVLQRQYAARAGRAQGPAGKVQRMRRPADATPIIGIVGWKKSGKTTLVTRLIAELTSRGLRIATVKHAHHDFQVDDKETDSARHRRAGAAQVAVVSARRWALINELHDAPEPPLEEVVSWLGPCDLIIVEGYKRAPISKIELRRRDAASQRSLADGDPHVIAVAADHPVDCGQLPVFRLDDVAAIADFIVSAAGLTRQAGVAAAPVVE